MSATGFKDFPPEKSPKPRVKKVRAWSVTCANKQGCYDKDYGILMTLFSTEKLARDAAYGCCRVREVIYYLPKERKKR